MLKKAPLCREWGIAESSAMDVWNEESYMDVPAETRGQMLERVWDYLNGHE